MPLFLVRTSAFVWLIAEHKAVTNKRCFIRFSNSNSLLNIITTSSGKKCFSLCMFASNTCTAFRLSTICSPCDGYGWCRWRWCRSGNYDDAYAGWSWQAWGSERGGGTLHSLNFEVWCILIINLIEACVSKWFHLSFVLIKWNFPTVGPPLEKAFWLLSGKHFFVPLVKNFSDARGDKLEINILSEPHFANISRRSCSCRKCKTSLGTFSMQ